MPPRDELTLRVLGLPIQMATTAVPAVLRDDCAVSAIDLVELGSGATKMSAVDVFVIAAEVERIRDKLLNSFAALCVQELDDASRDGVGRRTRIRSRGDRVD